jgi:uncharacterized protein YfaS (alpha-2-macroglobulin family)
MSRKFLLGIFVLIVATMISIPFIANRSESAVQITKVDPAFSGYVAAYTSGVISNESYIRVMLSEDYTGAITIDEAVTEEYFSFSPAIEGKAYWIDTRTIEFRPDKRLPSDQAYDVDFALSKLVANLPENLQRMKFSFRTMQQTMNYMLEGTKTTDKKTLRWQQMKGSIITGDAADNTELEKVLTATQNGKKLPIRWEHEIDHATHKFTVDSIARTDKAGSFTIEVNGKSIGVEFADSKKVDVPSLKDFKVLDIRVEQGQEQCVVVQFSDPIMEKQDLNGLIEIEKSKSTYRYTVEDNDVRVYPSEHLTGSYSINVNPGVKNILGFGLQKKQTQKVQFEDLKPEIKLVGNGIILPNTDKGLLFPFQVVNLNAVDVKIIRIYENNIPQFLQVNNLDGSNEMYRVGKVVMKKKVDLNIKSKSDYSRWTTYSLDLGQLIATEPGAIYRVNISFRKEYSMYNCPKDTTANTEETQYVPPTEEEFDPDMDNGEYGYYGGDYYDDYYWYWDGDRDDPCSNAYYYSRGITRNVLASDLGLMAKRGNDGSMLFAVNDIKTTMPLANVEMELYSFQNQLITTFKSDANGMAEVELPKKKPFLLVAKNGTQRGYLKLDDGSALSVSAFDVGGLEVQKGIKGMIYSERGVWRPGDTLFLGFILEDKLNVLPPNHPVTMEVYNARGQLVSRTVKSTSVNGFYNFPTPTDAEAPTGYWSAKVKVGGAVFTKNLKVEAIMPNRLKINMDFGKDGLASKADDKIDLSSNWLVGAPAKNLNAQVDVSLYESDTKFKGFDNYEFDDPASNFYTENQTIFEGNLDENGKATFSPSLNGKGAPGKLNASFNTRVFEQSGAFSIDYFTSEFSPYTHYVGVYTPEGYGWGGTLYTGTNNTILTQSVDETGKPVQRNELKVKVYKMSWRWWWSSGYNDLAYYVNSNYYEPILDTVINSDAKGKGSFNIKVGDDEYGRYLIRVTDKSGHSTGKVVWFDWPYWDGSSSRNNEAASLLQFTSDKKSYVVGETMNISIPSPGQGRALITVENGAGILGHYWVESKAKGNLTYSIPITSEMSPNVYVGVTLIQPHAQTVNDAPIRMYGVIPIVVDDPKTHLTPVITTAAVWSPESIANVSVKEQNGKPMTYTLAIVDEGLLDLTRFKTPDPWNNFYAREALGVKTWDMYDMVMGAYGAELERVLGIGGDGEGKDKGTQKANRFKPMVKFLGPFELKAGESKNHSVMMPQYVGSVRVMVIAGQDAAYGNAEKAVPVRKPLMILGTLPRVVGPGETVDLPVNVFAMESKVKDVTVTVSTNEMFTIADGATKTVNFKAVGEEVLTYKLNVAKAAGIGTVKIIAKGGGETAVYEIEIDVRNPNPKMTEAKEAIVDPGETWTSDYIPVGIQGTNSGTLEISSIPPLNLGERLQYLIAYPHGCIEQTTSAAFPQLYLDDVVDLTENQKGMIKDNVTAAVKHLRDFQTSAGGFAYWPGDQYPSEWGSNYAGHFLLEAEAKGYTLPSGVMEDWKAFQKEQAMNWSPRYDRFYYRNDDLIQAYRLYTLALAKAPELGAMNRLREVKTLTVQAKWRLAAAYHLAGQPEIAKQIVTGLATTVSPYTEYSYSYGSGDRDEAMILETLSLMGGTYRTMGAPVAKGLSDRMNRTYYYMNTQATAYALLAMCKFAAGDPGQTGVQAEYTIDGKSGSFDTKDAVAQTDMKVTTTKAGKVTVKNNGKGILFVRVVLAGVPEAGNEKDAQANLLMNVRYFSMNGYDLDPKQITQGTDFIAEVVISNPGLRGEYREMALTQIFPSGWEVRNERMMAGPGEPMAKSDYFDYRDIRDDRALTYFYINPNGSRTYRVQLHATYTGHFYLPAVYCESMYDNAVNARKMGMWVDVIPEVYN